MKKKKICIIGAGIFGCTFALNLNTNNYDVDLFDKENDILKGVSGKNQQRFHLGFHYPRSKKTILEIKTAYKDFINFFGKSFFGKTKNFYGISKIKSKINFRNYLNLLKKNKLKYRIIKNKLFSNLEGVIITKEKNLDINRFRDSLRKKIRKKKNINLKLNSKVGKINLSKYHKIIVATYFNNNDVLKNLGVKVQKLKPKKYELVEKIIVKLPQSLNNISLVILDGNFLNFDPVVGSKYHYLSVVKPAKIQIMKGKFPNFSNSNKKYLYKELIKNKNPKNFRKFIKISKKFVPSISRAKYIGSFYTVRCVDITKNDHIRNNDVKFYKKKKIISIISGKWNTCVSLSKKIEKKL